jgi:hypothetical protein
VDDVTVARGSVADVPSLEALWVSVHHAHQSSMPELSPYVGDVETWRQRSSLYLELFEKPDTFLFLARVPACSSGTPSAM